MKSSRRIREVDLERTDMDRGDPVGVVGGCTEGKGPCDEVESVHKAQGNDHHLRIAERNEEVSPIILAE